MTQLAKPQLKQAGRTTDGIWFRAYVSSPRLIPGGFQYGDDVVIKRNRDWYTYKASVDAVPEFQVPASDAKRYFRTIRTAVSNSLVPA